MKSFRSFTEETSDKRYHGSPVKFKEFGTTDVFLAKSIREARRYGPFVYEVTYEGKPRFSTPTIEVISPEQVTSLELVEHNKNQVVYRT